MFGAKADVLLRKGVYPYEYIDSLDKFIETQLPPIDKFYSKLTNEKIKQEDYNHAQKVWNEFNCKTLGDYHDLYLTVGYNLQTKPCRPVDHGPVRSGPKGDILQTKYLADQILCRVYSE